MKDFNRALKIVHGYFGYVDRDDRQTKIAAIERRIKDLKNKGYGGIVTNVGDENYLHNPEEWALMKEKARICRENDMRMWIYDEKGYPSGGAWKNTLQKNPDFEARAAVAVTRLLGPGENALMELPHGHEKTIRLMGFYIVGESATDEELLRNRVDFGCDDSLRIENKSDKNLLIMGFYKKHMFEGAHAQNNVCASRRYIDVSSRDAVAEFINNTYSKYAECLEPGDAEAFFTDEPSYMGHYINQGIRHSGYDDLPDENIVLYPVINWGRYAEKEFAEKYGYRIEDEIHWLFAGSCDEARRVRGDFYRLMSELFENSFFAQISDFCASKGFEFSGHVLLEDELSLHPKFEGNIIRFLSHMHVPGIDMLQSLPEIVRKFAFTPLLARSAAVLYNHPHVMDEVSAHAQGGKVTIGQVETSLMLQFALGADVFTSYYNDAAYSPAEQKRLFDALSYVTEKIGTRDTGKIQIYYPIDTVMRLYRPADVSFVHEGNDYNLMLSCQKNLEEAMNFYLDRREPFIFVDPDSPEQAAGLEPELLIIPGCFATDSLKKLTERLMSNGTRVVFYDPQGAFTGENKKLCCEDVDCLPSENAPVEGVVAVRGSSAELIVNSTAFEKKCRFYGNRPIAICEDPFTGEHLPVEDNTVIIKPYGTVLVQK